MGPMTDIVAMIRANRLIDAIKLFRTAFGGHICGLKEAKDAVEAIRDAITQPDNGEFIVVHKHANWTDHEATRFDAKDSALSYAERIVTDREEVYVARIVSKAVPKTTRTMQAVA